jgi:hypothetical protein
MLISLLMLGLILQTGAHDRVRTVKAERVQDRIQLDGRLNEASWSLAVGTTGFLQRDPDEGQPATEETEIRVLYDDDAIYVGVRLLDREPQEIIRRLARRDSVSDADRFTLYLDPHHDHLTGAMFEVSSANVRRDAVISNDTFEDQSWDAVWDSAVSVDEQGWCVEMRIPFSQLRFPRANSHTWGINAARYIHRRNETDWLELVPKKESGLASRMAHVAGIDGIEPKGNFEMVPYVVWRPTFVAPSSSQDPFNDGSRMPSAAGIDIKYGLSSNFTLNATINPDFGQVEVDPAVVNLSQFETFFPEKRPFFLEGTQIFQNFGRGGSNSFWGFNRADPNLFYSRRIGRSPQGGASAEFVDRPDATTILGAAKLTGKTKNGWSFGLLEAVAGREYAKLQGTSGRTRSEIEPLTNYFVARVHREMGRGGFGFLTTGVHRQFRQPELTDVLARRANVIGADGYYFLDRRREWVVHGNFAGSRVTGTRTAIQRLQEAPQRYYQRPDATHAKLDPSRTALGGWSGNVALNRNAGKYWTVNAALWAVNPGFESNDLGLHFRGDAWGAHTVLSLRKLDPDRWTRFRHISFAKFWTWDFANRKTGDGFLMFGGITLLNYWNINSAAGFFPRSVDPQLTRGGPVAASPSGQFTNFGFGTDERKKLSFRFGVNHARNESGGSEAGGELTVNVKPTAGLTISTGPNYGRSRNVAQYVTSVKDPAAGQTFGARYIFGDLDQKSFSMVTRVSWVLTPNVSVDLFTQPLISVGDYWTIKEFETPGHFRFRRYGDEGSRLAYFREERRYTIDPDADGPASPFTIADPNFNFKSLRVNAVFRWEWRLGSTLYFVWTQNRTDFQNPGQLSLGRDLGRLFIAPADDIFLVKFAYWFAK